MDGESTWSVDEEADPGNESEMKENTRKEQWCETAMGGKTAVG